jgi:sigma-B regulation protein RsbU (phosphoserine phosphatase)
MQIRSLEKRITRAESVLIALSIAAIAAADYAVGPNISLGPLYLIPLCYSALTQRRSITIVVFFLGLALRELLGPIELTGDPWFVFFRDLIIAAGFLTVAVYLGRLSVQRHEFFELARHQRDDLAAEVRLAAQLQSRLLQLNRAPTDRLDIYARTAPLKGVGGDYYDFLRLGPDRIGIVIADVAGKGLFAAMLMPAVRIALRSIIQRVDDPRQVVRELSHSIYLATEPENYATLFLATVDLDSGRLECVNAGHLPALLAHPDGAVHWIGAGGPPVGILPEPEYKSEISRLEPGGNLVLYTDGVTESQDAHGEEYGTERLASLVAGLAGRGSEKIVNAIRRDLLDHVAGGQLADDATAIAIRRQLPHESPGGTDTEFINTDSFGA